MRVYKVKVKKNGTVIQIKNWYCDLWVDGKKHKLPLFRSLSESERFAEKLDALAGAVKAGRPFDSQQQAWLSQLPSKMLQRLAKIGLVEQSRAEAAKDIFLFLSDYCASLSHRGNTEHHVKRTATRLKEVFGACGFTTLADIDAGKVERYLGQQQQSGRFHSWTINNYVRSLRAFGNFLVQNDKVDKNPFRYLKLVKIVDRKRPRRALSPDELAKLIAYTRTASDAYGLSGFERAVLYRFAAYTGLRIGEIRKLTVADFNAENKAITVQAAYAKNRKQAVLPLRKDVATELAELTAGKLPTVLIFGKVPQFLAARMLREDCQAAGVSTEGVDFHCLRYTFATLLVNSDVAPKTAMELMRHSDIRLTMQLYGQSFKSLERAAVEGLPSFDAQTEQEKKKKA